MSNVFDDEINISVLEIIEEKNGKKRNVLQNKEEE